MFSSMIYKIILFKIPLILLLCVAIVSLYNDYAKEKEFNVKKILYLFGLFFVIFGLIFYMLESFNLFF